MMDQSLEFTPVDLCAEAVVLLSKLRNTDYKIFHVYNENQFTMYELVNMLKKAKIAVNTLSTDEFNKKVVELSENESTKDSLKAIVNDLDNKRGLSFMPSVIITNDITNKYLAKLGFTWPHISFDYINKSLQIILEDK